MNALMDLYIDYLLVSTSYTTATGLAKLTNKDVSHDRITRMLSSRDYTASDLWKVAKPVYKSIESDDGVFIVDDSIEHKPFTDENELIAWHFDHTKNRSVKGINFIAAIYQTDKGVVPVGYELVRKTITVINKKTKKKQRKSPISKQDHYRNLILKGIENNIKFKYVLNDSWFSSAENMIFITNLNKKFIMPLKANRRVALSKEDKMAGKFVGIDSVKPGENVLVWLPGVDFPLRFVRQVFKDGDVVTGTLYLVSNDLELSNDEICTIYQRRWKVEEFNDSLKNNLSLAKSPTKTPRTQANHFFAAVCAFIRLEIISKMKNKNHFALKSMIYIEGLKKSMQVLGSFHAPPFFTNNILRPAPA